MRSPHRLRRVDALLARIVEIGFFSPIRRVSDLICRRARFPTPGKAGNGVAAAEVDRGPMDQARRAID